MRGSRVRAISESAKVRPNLRHQLLEPLSSEAEQLANLRTSLLMRACDASHNLARSFFNSTRAPARSTRVRRCCTPCSTSPPPLCRVARRLRRDPRQEKENMSIVQTSPLQKAAGEHFSCSSKATEGVDGGVLRHGRAAGCVARASGPFWSAFWSAERQGSYT